MKTKIIKRKLIVDKVLDEAIGKVKVAGGKRNPDITFVNTGHRCCHP